MSTKSKKEYLSAIWKRYKKSTKQEKTKILDEFCEVCGYNRNYAIRLLNKPNNPSKNKPRGRPKKYGSDIQMEVIIKIWKASNLPCSKRLKVIVAEWVDYYEKKLSEETIDLLKEISSNTIDKLLKPYRNQSMKLGLCTTKPGSIIRQHIPIKTVQWDERKPGNLELDTVAHCGSEIGGIYAFTLNAVDLLTGWIESRAIWGKGERNALVAIKNIEESIPFELLGFDSDNGNEFMNWHLIKYLQDRKKPVNFTRSREYHKNDNAHIEERNWSVTRQYLGYGRFDNPEIVDILNDLYKNELRLFLNFFIPSFKLIEKKRVGSKVIKKHEKPKTPFQRVLECEYVSKEKKQELIELKKKLNPFELKNIITKKIIYIQNHASKIQQQI